MTTDEQGMGLKVVDWRKPYRTMDESGTPESAGVVGWNWISEIAQQERVRDAALLVIQDTPMQGDGKVIRLYRSTTLLAVATLFRDDMNFTVLVRWLSPELARTIPAQPSVATDGDVVERIFAEVDAETAELPDMDHKQIAYATRCVEKALHHTMNDKPVTVHSGEQSSDMVERVARAINKVSCLAPVADVARAALEACHHAELVEAASKFASVAHRAGPTTDLYWAACERLEAVLAKLGGDA